jgi:predicted NBD/HSP70 family sugar kinase
VIEETARLMALAVVSVVATVDPEIVVLGGSIGSRPEFVDAVRAHLARLAGQPVRVEASALGNRSGIAGALAIGINNIHNSLFAPTFSSRSLSLPAIEDIAGLGVAS